MNKIKNRIFFNLILIILLIFLNKTFQKSIYKQSDRVYIELKSHIITDKTPGSFQEYEITFPDKQFKKAPSILYSITGFNMEDKFKGCSITTIQVNTTNLKYKVLNIDNLRQIDFQILAVDDPSIEIVHQNLIIKQNGVNSYPFQGSSSIQFFSAFISGWKTSSQGSIKIQQGYNRINELNYNLELNISLFQEVYLCYLIIYNNNKDVNNQNIYSSLYTYKLAIDTQLTNLGSQNPTNWIESTLLMDNSQILYGFNNIDLFTTNKCGGKIKTIVGNSLISGNKVNLQYTNESGMKRLNGQSIQFILQICENGDYMYIDDISKILYCTKNCFQLNHHYNNNIMNIQTLYNLEILMCEICSENCFGCVDGQPDKCIDCYNGKYLNPYNQKCEDIKPSGSFCVENNIEGKYFYNCQKCHESCAECTDGDEKSCTSCKTKTAYFFLGQCFQEQPKRTYCNLKK